MKPFGLVPNDVSHRPKCSCCTTKYNGNYRNVRATETKASARRAGKKRGRQAGKHEIHPEADCG